MKTHILLLALMFNCGAALAENNDIFDYDREEAIARLEERYGSEEGTEIVVTGDTAWVIKGKTRCGFFIKDSNWGVFTDGKGEVTLGFDSAAKKRRKVLKFIDCYRRR